MSTGSHLTLAQRRARVLRRLDEGQKIRHEALAGLDAEDAFLGSRWSVWEVLNHLDAESYVEALEQIVSGERDMLPPFNSREEKLKEDIEHLDATYRRFRALVESMPEERMDQPVTAPNPHNSYPGLTLLELVERSSGHASSHANQIVETRKYVAAFSTRERAVNFIALDPEQPSQLGVSAIGLLKYADYVAGTADALQAVDTFANGSPLVLDGENTEEVVSRLGRDTRAGLWAVVCTIGSPSELHQEVLRSAKRHCAKVVIHQAAS